MTDLERTSLVQRVSAGDADALQRLLVEYHAAWHDLVAGRLSAPLRSRLDPDDVLQEAYVAAFEALSNQSRDLLQSGDRKGADVPLTDVRGPESAPEIRSPPRFESPAAFYAWMERIVLNELRDAERAAGRQKRNVAREVAGRPTWATSCPGLLARVTATGTTPTRAFSRHEAVATLMTSLARLPSDQRAAVRWRFLEDVPVAEIGARLGKTETAVYTLCSRGLKGLRGTMEPTLGL